MLKLILADNQAIFRAGIAKVLAVEDEMRIVAQAQTQEQMFMALDKFRAAVLIVAGGFHSDFNSVLQASTKAKTRVVVLADTGESAPRYMGAAGTGAGHHPRQDVERSRGSNGSSFAAGADCGRHGVSHVLWMKGRPR